MAQTFTGRKRVRKFFGHIREVAQMPNLIEVQKASYDQFLMVDEPNGGRPDEGLQSVFKSVFPISDFSNTSLLEFVKYEFEQPKYDVDECRQRGNIVIANIKIDQTNIQTLEIAIRIRVVATKPLIARQTKSGPLRRQRLRLRHSLPRPRRQPPGTPSLCRSST